MGNIPYPGFFITLIIATGIWGASVLGLFHVSDALIYDWSVSHGPVDREPPNVLIVAFGERDRQADGGVWLEALERLAKLDAGQIVFSFTPRNASRSFYQRATQLGRVVFGRALEYDPANAEQPRLAAWPAAALEFQDRLPFGVVALPPTDRGIARRYVNAYTVEGQDYPSLAARVARHRNGDSGPPLEPEFRVDFSGGPEYLPTVALARLLKGGLIPELVAGKSVLLGPGPAPGQPGLHTPLGTALGLSPLVFEGYALHTLLEDQVIRPFAAVPLFVLLLIVTAINILLYQVGRLRFGLWLTGIALGLYGLLAWLLPNQALVWPPVTALAVAQIATFITITRHKAATEDFVTRQLILELSGQLRDHLKTPSFYTAQQPWTLVVNLVKQTLDLNWLIFLERIPNQYFVKEITALNCSMADIDERRRDYRRPPYSEAIAENRPIRLQKRLFLRLDAEHDQYMVPLVFSGEVLGFWAMGPLADAPARSPEFLTLVHGFGEQIAEMIYHRQQWLRRQQVVRAHGVFRYFRLAGGESLHVALKQIVTIYQRRLLGLERIFDSIGTAAIFYNPFGEVIQVNQSMAALAKKGRMLVYEMTALDLLNILCGLQLADGQRILQQVFVEHKTTTLPAGIPEDSRHYFILHVRPVVIGADSGEISDDATPFELRGILIELIDVTGLRDLSRLKGSLMERIYFQLRNDLQAVTLATDLLANQPSVAAESSDILEMIRQQTGDAIALVEQAQGYLFTNLLERHQIDCYPVDPLEALHEALASVAEPLRERRLSVDAQLPKLTRLVLAEPDRLREMLETMLLVLIDDAINDTPLTILLFEQEQTIAYTFSNQGFGMPDARFQDYLAGDGDVSPQFKKLRAALRRVGDWSGELRGSSALGAGTHLELKLRCFI